VRGRQVDKTWVWRPDPASPPPAALRGLVGKPVYGIGPVGADGRAEVTLHDGTRIQAGPGEVVAE
jgi:hypothetical protein